MMTWWAYWFFKATWDGHELVPDPCPVDPPSYQHKQGVAKEDHKKLSQKFHLSAKDCQINSKKNSHLKSSQIQPGESVCEGGPGGVLDGLVVTVEGVLHRLLGVVQQDLPHWDHHTIEDLLIIKFGHIFLYLSQATFPQALTWSLAASDSLNKILRWDFPRIPAKVSKTLTRQRRE